MSNGAGIIESEIGKSIFQRDKAIIEDRINLEEEGKRLEYVRQYVENVLGVTRDDTESYRRLTEGILDNYEKLDEIAKSIEEKGFKDENAKGAINTFGALLGGATGNVSGAVTGLSAAGWISNKAFKGEDANSYQATAAKLPFDKAFVSSLAQSLMQNDQIMASLGAQLLKDERFLSGLESYFNVSRAGEPLGTEPPSTGLGTDNSLLKTSTGPAGTQQSMGGAGYAPSSGDGLWEGVEAHRRGSMGNIPGGLLSLPGMNGGQTDIGSLLGLFGLGGQNGGLLGGLFGMGGNQGGGLGGILGGMLGGTNGETPFSSLEKGIDGILDKNSDLFASFEETFGGVEELGGMLADGLSGSFADMGLTLLTTSLDYFGKLGFLTGLSAKAFASLKSMNPWTAMAAGAALMTISSQLKRLSSSVGSGSTPSVTGGSALSSMEQSKQEQQKPATDIKVVIVDGNGSRRGSQNDVDRVLGRADIDRALREQLYENNYPLAA